MPLLLDLFCCGGGACFGYKQAGLDVIGVDIKNQRRYAGDFVRMDAITCMDILLGGGLIYPALHGEGSLTTVRGYGLSDFAAIHASPPCQKYCSLRHLHPDKEYPDLISATRAVLIESGLPYVIENVYGAKKLLINPIRLCGSMFRLGCNIGTERAAELERHRLFETNWGLTCEMKCERGWARGQTITVQGTGNALGAEGMRDRRAVISVAGDTPHNPRTYRAVQRGMKDPNQEEGGGKRRVISVIGSSTENPATTHKGENHHSASEKKRTITVTGHEAFDPGENSRRRRTISVIGATPRDLSIDKADQRRRCIGITGNTAQQNVEHNKVRETFSIGEAQEAMGIDWLTMKELSQAIPPAYTEFIGKQLMEMLTN